MTPTDATNPPPPAPEGASNPGVQETSETTAKIPPASHGEGLGGAFVALAVLLVIQFIANWPVWCDILTIACKDEEASQVLLAPIVCAYLLFVRKHQFENWVVRGRWVGIPILLLAWAFQVTGDLRGWESVWHTSAVLSVIGCVVAALGTEVIRRFAPALLVLFFMVPVPGVLRRMIAFPLQEWTAWAAAQISVALGMNVEQSGNLLYINNQAVAVAEACNGLRMIFALGLVTWALAFGSRISWWQRLIVLALTPALAVLANLIRVVPTLWFYGYADKELADTVHLGAGWLMLAMAFVLPKLVLGKIEKPELPPEPVDRRPGWLERRGLPGYIAPAAVGVILIGIGVVLPPFEMPPNREVYFKTIRDLAIDLPYQIGEWEGYDTPPQEAAERLLHPNIIMQREYRNIVTDQYLSLLFVHCGDLRDMEGHYPMNCYRNQGWQLAPDDGIVHYDVQTAMLDFGVRRYRFMPGRWQDHQMFVYSFFILPVDEILAEYAPVRAAAGDPKRRFYGGAQVQLVFDKATTTEQQLDAVQLFAATMTDLLQTIEAGSSSPKLKLEPASE